MKSSLLRAVVALVAGVLMVVYPDRMATWITRAIGVLFLLAGVISIVFYAVARRRYDDDVVRSECADGGRTAVLHKPIAPIVGVGCAVLGVILALMPQLVAAALVYVFAALLLLGALGQFYILISTQLLLREVERGLGTRLPLSCGYGYWVLPILLFLFGLFTLVRPDIVVSSSFLFIGIAMLVYGLSEVASAIKAHSVERYVRRHRAATVAIDSEEGTPAGSIEVKEATTAEAEAVAEEEEPSITVVRAADEAIEDAEII